MGKMIRFTVYGKPAQVGSKRAFVVGEEKKQETSGAKWVKNPRAVLTDDNSERQQQWYQAVAQKAAREMERIPLLTGPIRLTMRFYFRRPGTHYGSGKSTKDVLKASAPKYHTQTPDHDKLTRNTQDALTAVVWHDDKQVCECDVARVWAEDGKEKAIIMIEELE